MFSLLRVPTVETRKLDKCLLQGKTCHLHSKSTLKRPSGNNCLCLLPGRKMLFSRQFFFSRSLLVSWISPNRSKIIWNFFYEKKKIKKLFGGVLERWQGHLEYWQKVSTLAWGHLQFFLRVNLRKMVWVPAILVQNLKIPVFCSW